MKLVTWTLIGIGGYVVYQGVKKKAEAASNQKAISTIAKAPGSLASIFDSISSKVSHLLSGTAPTVTLSPATVQNVGPSSNRLGPDGPVEFDGYYGSLGSYGDGGSVGGCHSLGCGKYGSLS